MPPEIKLASLKEPGASLRAALLGFSDAIARDIDNLADDTITRIHDIRVATKKIRALLLLAGKCVPQAEEKILFGLLREIRGCFAGSRDAGVMRARLRRLLPEEDAHAAIRQLHLEERNEPVDTAAAIVWTTEINTRLKGLELDGLKTRKILREACRSYDKARDLRKKCRRLDDDVLMHTWRKRVKEFCYHTMALEDLKLMEKLISKADGLAETLGDYHDLALLATRAKDEKNILAVVAEAKEKTGRQCLKLSTRVFRATPRQFEEKLFSQI